MNTSGVGAGLVWLLTGCHNVGCSHVQDGLVDCGRLHGSSPEVRLGNYGPTTRVNQARHRWVVRRDGSDLRVLEVDNMSNEGTWAEVEDDLMQYDRLLEWLRTHARTPSNIGWEHNFGGEGQHVDHWMGGGWHHEAGTNVATCSQCLDDFLDQTVTQPEVKSYE